MGLYIIYKYLEWKHFTPRGRRKLCFSHKWGKQIHVFFFIQGLIFVLFLKKKYIMARSLMLGRWRLLTEQISVNNIYLAMCFEIFETSTCWLGNPCIDVGKWAISTLDWYIKIYLIFHYCCRAFNIFQVYQYFTIYRQSFLLKL
jgi:hypothetical protein